MKDCYFTEPM